MQFAEHFAFFELLLRRVDLINEGIPRHPLNLYRFFGLKLSLNFLVGNQTTVLQLIDEASVIGLVRIDTEHNW